MDEYQSDDSNGKMGWFWSKEGSIWKKLFVAGFVIMSAPFVLPPLVVASMILVLSSIPYGLFLVTYACTEKLMSALLPSTASPSLFLLDGGGDETWVVKKDPETRGFEGYPDEREGEQIMIEIKGGGLMEEDEPEPATDELLQAETNPIVVAIEGDEKSSKEANIEVELNQSTGLPENEELVQETRSSMENTKDEGNRGAKDDINEKAPTKEDDTVGESDKNLEENKGEEIQEKETKGIGPGAGDNIRKDLVEGTKATDEQTPAATGGASTHSSSGKDADEGSDEVLPFGETKLWENIDAVRVITGYKVARNSGFVEEIKALYLFTGVEPLVSFKDETDMAEASDKLRFLMSFVGIK